MQTQPVQAALDVLVPHLRLRPSVTLSAEASTLVNVVGELVSQ